MNLAKEVGKFEAPPDCQISNLATIFEVFFSNQESGVFVEVGAHDGKKTSNTWNLAQIGWEGHYIEPVSEYANRCALNHANNPKISTHQVAVSNTSGQKIRINKAGGLSTSKMELINEYKNLWWARDNISNEFEIVETVTLDSFLQDNKIPIAFDLLVVDVEGFEVEVFEGFDLEKWSPRVMIVELSDLHPDLRSMRSEMAKLYLYILGQGYIVAYKDSINTIFVEKSTWFKLYGGLS